MIASNVALLQQPLRGHANRCRWSLASPGNHRLRIQSVAIAVRAFDDRCAGFRLNDIWNGAPPRGPQRLDRKERDTLAHRISTAFPAGLRKALMLSEAKWAYELDGGELCHWRGRNIAADRQECNRVRSARPGSWRCCARCMPRAKAF